MGRRLLCAVTALVALTLTSCGESADDLVVQGSPPPSPYDGPLDLLPVDAPDEDEDDAFVPVEGLGSAGRALECDWEVMSGGRAETWGDAGGDTPEEGLEFYFEMDQPSLPQTGYRIEREAQGRVLFSYDVKGRTKIAVVVAKDQPDRPGWGPETTAHCDVAELPESITDDRGEEIWRDRAGRRVPTAFVSSSKGAEHCDWQKAHFLGLDSGKKRSLYARDPEKVLPEEMLTSPYDGDADMPPDAKDTGYHLDDWRLWRTPDNSAVYVRTSDGVERWPAVEGGCA